MVSSLDILAIAAHRDDVEQTCGGALLKGAQRGERTGILDLTQGEMGTRGTAEDRAREALDAARILGAGSRRLRSMNGAATTRTAPTLSRKSVQAGRCQSTSCS